MKEKLIIRNFGPIKNVELELARFNVLIGENATGKSTVSKVLAVCRYFSYILDDKLFPNAFENGLNARGLTEYIQSSSYISYDCKHYSFIAEKGLKKETDIDHQNGSIIAEYERQVFLLH
ncbi:MAG: AAA family ATPase [Segetibacter sp.]